jgi:hypothetical protein
MSAQAIHHGLVRPLGAEAPVYSRVTNHLPTAGFDRAKDPLGPDANQVHLDDSDKVIWAALEEKPFASVRELA